MTRSGSIPDLRTSTPKPRPLAHRSGSCPTVKCPVIPSIKTCQQIEPVICSLFRSVIDYWDPSRIVASVTSEQNVEKTKDKAYARIAGILLSIGV